MSPYSVAPPPEQEEALLHPEDEQAAPRAAKKSASAPCSACAAPHVRHKLFEEALLEMSTTRPRRRTIDFVLSIAIHFSLLGTLILVPLYFTEAIDLKQFTQTLLVAPPPPPPPPPAAPPVIKSVPTRRVFMSGGKLLAPTAIPQQIAMIKEEPLPPEVASGGTAGGVPGGVPGGQAGGVIGGIIGSAPKSLVLAAPTAAPKAPIRVGGRIRVPQAISRPDPVYPVLARQAKIEGNVVIDAVIDESGNITEMQVVSGHVLLIPPAVEALRKWKYEPTRLNDEPVPVRLIVTVIFRLQ